MRRYIPKAPVLAALVLLAACLQANAAVYHVDYDHLRKGPGRALASGTGQGAGLAYALLEDGAVRIVFPPLAPAYWLRIELTVQNGEFTSRVQGQALGPGEVIHRLDSQRLALDKRAYKPGDELHGYLDMAFTDTVIKTGKEYSFYIRGPFSAVVREKNFDPKAEENIKTYSLPVALYELTCVDFARELTLGTDGAYSDAALEIPSHENIARPDGEEARRLHELRKALFLLKPQPEGEVVREVTWDISPRQCYNGGDKRLTIWFTSASGTGWQQLDFAKWNRR